MKKVRGLAFLLAMSLSLSCLMPVNAEETETMETETSIAFDEEETETEPTTIESSTIETSISIEETETVSDYEETEMFDSDIVLLSGESEPKVESTIIGNGAFEISIQGIEESTDIKAVYAPTWQSGDQSDIRWYKAEKQDDGSYLIKGNISNHKYHTGIYKIHIYIEKKDHTKTLILNTTMTMPGMSAGAFYDVQEESSKTLVLEDLMDQGIAKKVYFAVWSNANGQDDICWYTATASETIYTAEVMAYKHGDLGKYTAHAYVAGKDGSMTLIKALTFQVDEWPDEKIEVVDADASKGQVSVEFYFNRISSDITKVCLAAWSKSDQSDIYWYEAKKQTDESYIVTIDVKNHKYNLGEYYLQGYVCDKKGEMHLVDETSYMVKLEAGAFSVQENSSGDSMKLSLEDVKTQGISKQVYFAVWSSKNGQDDIRWYKATEENGAYSVDMMYYNHKDVGTYHAHVYISGKDGAMHLLMGTSFTVDSIPEEKVLITNVDCVKGTFQAEVYLNRRESDIQEVQVAAWTKSDQRDIYWYTAEKQSNGRYLIQGDVGKHNYNIGEYNFYAYVRDKKGNRNFVASSSQRIELSVGDVSIQSTDSEYMKQITLNDAEIQDLANKVYFAVWSAENGQDDIYWYEAEMSGTSYVLNVLLHNHKHLGTYYVHIYAKMKNGSMQLVKAATFEFDATSMPKEYLEISNVDEENGTFDVNVYLTRSKSDIKTVYIPVWTKANQSNIYWYTAKRQSNGSYYVQVDATKHQWASGKYYVHTYVQSPDGNKNFISGQSVNMQLDHKIVVEKIDQYSVSVKIYGLDDNVTMVRFQAWSVTNGQDDIVWYMGTQNADGSWGTEIHSKNHKDIGEYECQIYATTNGDEVCVDRTVCTIEKQWKNTWVWIDGYKRYINSDGEIDTDVSRLVTGPYFIKVYKWSNYVIVYAKDEYGNFTVPVKAMIASCGNATPTGTYYATNRWRWLTMVGGSKAQWCTQILGDYLFHSVPYKIADPTTLYTDLMYNYLGTTQSLGCIRLQAGDAKWIYDNCEYGTEVLITPYESEGPIAKPTFTPIPSWHTWDPTDPTTQYLCKQHGCH